MTINGKINIKLCRGGIGRNSSIFKEKIKVLTLEDEDVVSPGILASGDDGSVMVQSRSI